MVGHFPSSSDRLCGVHGHRKLPRGGGKISVPLVGHSHDRPWLGGFLMRERWHICWSCCATFVGVSTGLLTRFDLPSAVAAVARVVGLH